MIYLFLFGSLAFKLFLESFTSRYWGDFFLALGLCFSLELPVKKRNLLLILVGIVEGFFSSSIVLTGVFSAFVVIHLQTLLSRALNFSLWYPSILALGISLFFFKFILDLFIPYLIELPLPANCLRLFLWDFLLTYIWIVFFHFLIYKCNFLRGVLIGR